MDFDIENQMPIEIQAKAKIVNISPDVLESPHQ